MSSNFDIPNSLPSTSIAGHASNFPQTGSWSMVDLLSKPINVTVGILQRYNARRVDPYTAVVGQAMCSRFQLAAVGRKRLDDALSSLSAVGSLGDVLYFGFGAEDIVRSLSKTEEGAIWLAMCAEVNHLQSSPESAFQYTQLDRDGFIRVLVLEEAPTTEASLKGSLVYLRVDDNPSYDAISYTWGGSESPESLHLTGGLSKITENLSPALRRFRLADKPRNLWVDAVCIYQRDNVEKGHQVAMMSKIYRNAITVLI